MPYQPGQLQGPGQRDAGWFVIRRRGEDSDAPTAMGPGLTELSFLHKQY